MKSHYTIAVLHWSDGSHNKIHAYGISLCEVLINVMTTENWKDRELSKKYRKGLRFSVSHIETYEHLREASEADGRIKCKEACVICG